MRCGKPRPVGNPHGGALTRSGNEGMEGEDEGLDQRDTHRLGEVMRAKEKIGAKPKRKPSQ
jgi:hypothetical protein